MVEGEAKAKKQNQKVSGHSVRGVIAASPEIKLTLAPCGSPEPMLIHIDFSSWKGAFVRHGIGGTVRRRCLSPGENCRLILFPALMVVSTVLYIRRTEQDP